MGREPADVSGQDQRMGGAEWIQLRKEILSRDEYQCANCGAEDKLEIHHVVPLSRGGTNRTTNLLTICKECHNNVHNKQTRDSNIEMEDNRWLPTINKVRQLVRSTQHPQRKAVIGLLAKTGIGAGEICNINMDDVFIDDSDIRESYDVQKPRWVKNDKPTLRIQVATKTPHSTRRERLETTIIPLDDEICYLLKYWLAIRPDAIASTEPLFLSTSENWGERISPQIIRYIVERETKPLSRLTDSNQSSDITPYSLRYFFAERFPGQPSVRDYILGRRQIQPMSIDYIFEQ